MKPTVSAAITNALRAQEWPHARLADRVGVSLTSVRNWTRGKCVPGDATLRRVARVLGMDALRLLALAAAERAERGGR